MDEISNNEDIIKDSNSGSEDWEEDNPIKEFPERDSEIEETKKSESYKAEDKIIYKLQVLFSASEGEGEGKGIVIPTHHLLVSFKLVVTQIDRLQETEDNMTE